MYPCHVCEKTFARRYNLCRHISSHGPKSFQCQQCSKCYSQKIKLKIHEVRHQKGTKFTSIEDPLRCVACSKQFSRAYNLKRHRGVCRGKIEKGSMHTIANILMEMQNDEREFQSRLELGEIVSTLLLKHDDLSEHSLSEGKKLALKLYRRYQVPLLSEFENVRLKPWQRDVVEFINHPNKREVIWIMGKRGKEGKTFLQDYIKYYHGERRVIATDITGNKRNIAHFLSKCTLACKDIFLFNHPCSTTDSVAYDLLEGIKDGRILSHKYNTEQLIFNTPNIVIVFSNHQPDMNALKRDRWSIYDIQDDNLVQKCGKRKADPILQTD